MARLSTTRLSYWFLIVVILQSSCFWARKRTEPSYPTNVSAWQPYTRQGVKFRGSFVLQKGERTKDGGLQITLLDTLAPDFLAESGSHNALARARLQFLNTDSQRILCENNYAEGEGRNLAVDCGDEIERFGVIGIGVRAINLKEGWVFFELSGEKP